MAAGVKNITIEQGATFIMNVTLTTDGTIPIDLTGFLGRGSIKTKATDLISLAEFDVEVSDAVHGVVTISMSATTSSTIQTKGTSYNVLTQAVYDIEIYKGDEVIRLLNGQVFISPEVTK